MGFIKSEFFIEYGLIPLSVAPIIGACLIITLLLLAREAYRTDIPKIKGIPEAPGALPFIGHLGPLGGREKCNSTVIFSRWAKATKSDVYQIKLGSQRAVIVQGWPAIKDLWLGHSNALCDRPWQPGFIDKLGVDIAGSPLTPQIKRCRLAAMKALGKPMWPLYYPLLEPSSVVMLKRIYERGQNGRKSIDLFPYFRQVVYDLALNITYGARMDDINDSIATQLIEAVDTINEIRTSTAEFSYYVPLLRLIPRSQTNILEAEQKRGTQLDYLYRQYLDKAEKGDVPKCIISSDNDKLTLEEIRGTCASLLHAASDTVASVIYMAFAWLSSEEGRKFQPVALKAILDEYNGDRDRAWKMAFREQSVPLIESMYKESLRCYSPAPFGLIRATSREIIYRDFAIPKGVSVVMNTQDANLDPEYFGPDARTFNPARFIGNDAALPHLAYGAGIRQCPGANISNRIIYGLLCRTILAFEIREATEPEARRPSLNMRDFSDGHGIVCVPRPYDCCMVARDTEWLTKLPLESGKE